MYRPVLKPRDRLASLLLVGAIHAGLIFAMLNLAGAIDVVSRDDLTQLIDLASEPPPPPMEEVEVPLQAAPEEEGEASPPNIESQATPIPDPQPRIALPVPTPMPVSPTPNTGSEATQGAAPVLGPGTGAGGVGTGTGAGGSGSGSGGGGDGIATRAQLLSPSLRSRDYPPEFRRQLSRGAVPFVIFTVQPNGRVSDCRIYQSSGDPALDDVTCRLVSARFVYRPAFNRRGEPVASQMAYRQAQ